MSSSGTASSFTASVVSSAAGKPQWPSPMASVSANEIPARTRIIAVFSMPSRSAIRICGTEADAPDVAGQPVGILAHDLHGIGAVGLEDAHRAGRADAVLVQKHHDLADHLLVRPGRGDPGRPCRSDPRDLAQTAGAGFDDVEHVRAEQLDHALGRPGRCPGSCRSRDISRCLRPMTVRAAAPNSRIDPNAWFLHAEGSGFSDQPCLFTSVLPSRSHSWGIGPRLCDEPGVALPAFSGTLKSRCARSRRR